MALLKDNLIAHYKMNDDAATAVVVDETGDHEGEYQLNDVAQNTSTGAEAGKIFGALDFVGGANGEHIEIADHADFTPAGTPFSISVWVYMHDATNFMIASKGVLDTDGEWRFELNPSDQIIMRLMDESVDSCFISRYANAALTSYENKWIHLVVTYDGSGSSSGIKIYLNGVRVDDTEWNLGAFVAVENLNHAVWIGRYDDTYANGLIDNAMFFNKELSPLEIKYLYNGGAGTENIPTLIELSRTGQHLSSFQY